MFPKWTRGFGVHSVSIFFAGFATLYGSFIYSVGIYAMRDINPCFQNLHISSEGQSILWLGRGTSVKVGMCENKTKVSLPILVQKRS